MDWDLDTNPNGGEEYSNIWILSDYKYCSQGVKPYHKSPNKNKFSPNSCSLWFRDVQFIPPQACPKCYGWCLEHITKHVFVSPLVSVSLQFHSVP